MELPQGKNSGEFLQSTPWQLHLWPYHLLPNPQFQLPHQYPLPEWQKQQQTHPSSCLPHMNGSPPPPWGLWQTAVKKYLVVSKIDGQHRQPLSHRWGRELGHYKNEGWMQGKKWYIHNIKKIHFRRQVGNMRSYNGCHIRIIMYHLKIEHTIYINFIKSKWTKKPLTDKEASPSLGHPDLSRNLGGGKYVC